MSVTAPAGFEASGVARGLKSSGAHDLALVVNRGPSNAAAAVFTSNRCKANPVLWSEQAIADGVASAIILNSGGANCYTGSFGFQTTHATAEAVAEQLAISAGDVVVCSTGLIGTGDQSFRDAVVGGVPAAVAALSAAGGQDAALAIMTTDSRPKEAVFDSGAGWSIGGMAKGAGMLAPGLATMLVVITTDADLPSAALDAALRSATRVTFDRLDSDGCMSTNDTVTLLASGASGMQPDQTAFTDALTKVCRDLALQLQADAEGAGHNIAITVVNAATEDEAVVVARAVSRSNLFKAAIFGNDPNWGRVLAAIGTTDAAFDPYNIDVTINGVKVCQAGEPFEDRDLVDLTPRAVSVLIDLNEGSEQATILTNDLTHDYVHEEQRVLQLMAKHTLTPDSEPEFAAVKAATLIESLPWLKAFHGQIMVIKFGGNAMVDESLQRSFAEDMVYLRYVGIRPVVVHGGGPQITQMLTNLGIASEFRYGHRVTSPEAMAVVRSVLTEQISPEIVNQINEHGLLAVAISGDEARLFEGRKRRVEINGETLDLGLVGDIVGVNPERLIQQLDAGQIPVVSSIAPDIDVPGQVLNVNADAAAAALAVKLGAAKLVILTDVTGLYSDWPNRDSLVSMIQADELRDLLPSLESGMIPKMSACLTAVDGGVPKAAIIDGRIPHSMLLEVFTQSGIGTEVVMETV